MKILIVLFLGFLSFEAAMATNFCGQVLGKEDSPITLIENESLICEDPGVMYAMDTTLGAERVWQSDPGQVEGIELSLISFDRGRCPYCYFIRGEIRMFGESLKVDLEVSQTLTDVNFPAEAKLHLDGEYIKTLPCYLKQ
ncbi:MAG: hypothetical protein IPK04_00950 [Bdellovibrionales bacterium]|nr:hypothetical protein [Bdellovibrionales bacterium]